MSAFIKTVREQIIRHNFLASLPIPGCNDSTVPWDYDKPEALKISENIESSQSRDRSILVKQLSDITRFLVKEESQTTGIPIEDIVYGFLKDWPPAEPIEFKASQFELNEEIVAFSSKHGILAYIPEVLTLIENSFPLIEAMSVKIMEDPEVDEEWVSFEITIHGEVDEVLEGYDKYVTQFVSKVPWPECDKIRLSYFII